MDQSPRCQDCDVPLTGQAVGGLCANCLLKLALEPADGLNAMADEPGEKISVGTAAPREVVGSRIGRYKLLQEIGEGGFGIVYLADQLEPVKRRVALKVLKPGMDTRDVVARFEAERQSLALMDHPNIARIFDGGQTESGRPYFVMELVKGIPLTKYCDDQQLTTRQRLDLFLDVLAAVQHAHQKGIIHRDLKPSNILVSPHDGRPVIKVIDFGIAKAISMELTEKTLFTAHGWMIGTPQYMSPEQAEVNALDVDTRSDIYSLGVILYELLTGRTPLDGKKLRSAAYAEIQRLIREEEPPKPSTRLGTLGTALPDIARRRGTEPMKLSKQVRGDLDWIVMKCLEKDRARRFETANGLAADIGRYLRREPVVARPSSFGYRSGKFIRKHRGPVAAAAAIVMALIGGLTASTVLYLREKTALAGEHEQRQRAQASEKAAQDSEASVQIESAKHAQTARFLEEMLAGVQPEEALGGDITLLKKILEKAALRVGIDLKEQPEVEASLRITIGTTYSALGLYSEAEEHLRAALVIRRQLFGTDDLQVANTINDLAQALYKQGNYPEAETMHRDALRIRTTILGEENLDVAVSMSNLAETLRRNGGRGNPETERLLRKALVIRMKLQGPEHADTATLISNLGIFLWRDNRYAEAEITQREALAIRRGLFGGDHPDVADSLSRLGSVLTSQKKYDESETVNFEALMIRRNLFADQHPEVAYSLAHLGLLRMIQARYDEAEQYHREALAIRRKLLGYEHTDTIGSFRSVAEALRARGKLAEAESVYREGLTLPRKHLVSTRPQMKGDLSETFTGLLDVMRRQGRLNELKVFLDGELKLAEGNETSEWRGQLAVYFDRVGAAHRAGKNEDAADECIRISREIQKPLRALKFNGFLGRAPVARAVLVMPTSSWKWLHPTDGKDPETDSPGFHQTFSRIGFDDSSWQQGDDADGPAGGFAYGEELFDGVDIGKPEKAVQRDTAWFRHRFTTKRTHSNLEFRCQRDDGIVVYLDGKEVIRDNMEEGPDSGRLAAINAIADDDEFMQIRYRIPGSLAAGEHILAISLHNPVRPSTDLRLAGVTLVELESAVDGK